MWRSWASRCAAFVRRVAAPVVGYLRSRSPTPSNTFVVFLVVAALVYARSLRTNYIFDEQEALLANPYVNGNSLGFFQVLERDFWGLPHTRSIGSYRPLPNVVWRLLWKIHDHPWLPHAFNVMIHALNASLLARFVWSWTRGHALSWLGGGVFLLTAVLTEAVCGVVGLADVLGGLGVLLALVSLSRPLPQMIVLVFASITLGMFSKESTMTATVLVGLAALVSAPALHERRPLRLLRCLGATAASVAALTLYTACRRHFFPAPSSVELDRNLPSDAPLVERAMHGFLAWFQQPRLPRDPINNPLVDADVPHRIAGGLRVYAEGLGQVVFPHPLSGDYSFPQEPIPERLVFFGSVVGALGMLVPVCAALAFYVQSLRRELRSRGDTPHPLHDARLWALLALALAWVPLAYVPHGNFLKLLPTVRAERFWYLPAIGTSILVATTLLWVARRWTNRSLGRWVVAAFLLVQAGAARWHAFDYADDLAFWRATSRSSPNSAKAHLNYGVMLGAHTADDGWLDVLRFWSASEPSAEERERRRKAALEARLVENTRAIELAPEWPMAHVYQGDALCRLARVDEAWRYYRKGFELGPDEQSLIALALQCMWDDETNGEKGHWIEVKRDELLALASAHDGSWLEYLARDVVYRGKEHGGVESKYRPRSYDGGPTEERSPK